MAIGKARPSNAPMVKKAMENFLLNFGFENCEFNRGYIQLFGFKQLKKATSGALNKIERVNRRNRYKYSDTNITFLVGIGEVLSFNFIIGK